MRALPDDWEKLPLIIKQEHGRHGRSLFNQVTAKGGRYGSIPTDDGVLDLALPKSLGDQGGATNPEQLFAEGYVAGFENALLRVGREAKTPASEQDVEVTAKIDLDQNQGNAFVLSARLIVSIAGLPQQQAEDLVRRAGLIWPLLQCDQRKYCRANQC